MHVSWMCALSSPNVSWTSNYVTGRVWAALSLTDAKCETIEIDRLSDWTNWNFKVVRRPTLLNFSNIADSYSCQCHNHNRVTIVTFSTERASPGIAMSMILAYYWSRSVKLWNAVHIRAHVTYITWEAILRSRKSSVRNLIQS